MSAQYRVHCRFEDAKAHGVFPPNIHISLRYKTIVVWSGDRLARNENRVLFIFPSAASTMRWIVACEQAGRLLDKDGNPFTIE